VAARPGRVFVRMVGALRSRVTISGRAFQLVPPSADVEGMVAEAVDQSSAAAGVATGRDWQRSLRFFVILGVLSVPFLLLLLLVTDKWAPLAAADQGARDPFTCSRWGSRNSSD
jgi:hypothetical protein